MEIFSRTKMLIGEEGLNILKNSRIAVFGVGGVGGYVVEALVRSGIGQIDVFDNDTVSVSNINRQIIATTATVGKLKVDAIKERALLINPEVRINTHNCFYMPSNSSQFDFSVYDYIVDAIDTVTGKIEIIMKAQEAGKPVISSMGTGNKLEASMLEVSDIYKTSVCPLARVMRQEMKKRGVKKLKVVYSREQPIQPVKNANHTDSDTRKPIPGSISFVPATAGLIIAGEVVKDIIKRK
jgi:tRNA A37 threonylcarbamoyladenosine dehydratase